MGIKKDIKMFDFYTKVSQYCPNCGHTMIIPSQINYKICNWCGNKVYRTKECEFKDKFKLAQIKENKNER